MNIVVIGGGAIGLLVTGRLAHAGQQVALLARASTVEALRSGQIHGTQYGQTLPIDAPPVALEPGGLPSSFHQPDLAIICVKSYDTQPTLATLAALRPQQILTLQNGIGNEETLADHMGEDRILSGAITTSVQLDAPGAITVTKEGGIGLAALAPRYLSLTTSVAAHAALLRAAGFVVREYPNYRALKWSKALLNMLGNAIPAILDMSVAAVFANRDLVALERQAFREALTVMHHQGIRPVNLPSYPAAVLALAMRRLPQRLLAPLLQRLMVGGRGGKLPSLHTDLRQGQSASEGAYLYGAVAQTANENGLAAPVNATLWQVLRAIVSGEQPWDTYRHNPERLLQTVQTAGAGVPQMTTDQP